MAISNSTTEIDFDILNASAATALRKTFPAAHDPHGTPDTVGSALLDIFDGELGEASDIGVRAYEPFDLGVQAGLRIAMAVIQSPLSVSAAELQEILTGIKAGLQSSIAGQKRENNLAAQVAAALNEQR